MKIKLHVSYTTNKYLEGFRFRTEQFYFEEEIYLGAIEIDMPFEVPSLEKLNSFKADGINAEIKEHKAKINLLENQVKDLLSIENKTVEVWYG